MTISTSSRVAGPFAGNGVTIAFPFTFKVFSSAELRVIKTSTTGIESDLVIGGNPTVVLNADQDVNPGGTLTYTTLATGEKLTILGATPAAQPTDITNGSGFYASVIEAALDRCMMVVQQALTLITRAISFPASDSSALNKTLPTSTLRANKALVFGADGSVGVSTDNYNDQVAAVAASAAAAAASAGSASASATSATSSAATASAAASSASSSAAAAAAAAGSAGGLRFSNRRRLTSNTTLTGTDNGADIELLSTSQFTVTMMSHSLLANGNALKLTNFGTAPVLLANGGGSNVFFNGTSNVTSFTLGPKQWVIFVGTGGDVINATVGSTEPTLTTVTNLVINPHGAIQQETTTPQTVQTAYFADQWVQLGAGSGFTWEQGVISDGSVSLFDPCHFYTKTTGAKASLAAGDSSNMAQPIEGRALRVLKYGTANARGSWLRFRASGSQSGIISVSIRNAAANRSFVHVVAITTTPTDYAVFVPGDTSGTWPSDDTQGAAISFCHAAGTTFQTATQDAWVAGNFLAHTSQSNCLDTVNRQTNITDVSWTATQSLQPFFPTQWDSELIRCQRYFEKSYNYSILVGAVSTGGRWEELRNKTTGIQQFGQVVFKTRKRGSPTVITFSDASGAANFVAQDDGSAVASTVSAQGEGAARVTWTNGASRFGATFHWTASSRM